MDESRWLAGATIVMVFAVTVASGPLVGAVDLTPDAEDVAPPGRGTADVRLVDVPRTMTLKRGDFGAGTYHLVGPVRVSVGAVSGNPLLEYVVRVPALEVADVHEYNLRETPNRSMDLTVRPFEVSPRLVERDTYHGTIEIRVQSDDFEVLYEGEVSVEVVQ